MRKHRPVLLAVLGLAMLFAIAAYLNTLLPKTSSIGHTESVYHPGPGELDPNKLPLYPGAQNEQVQFALRMRRITYSVAASPQAIGEYYRSELSRLGWKYDPDSKVIAGRNRGMNFFYSFPMQSGPIQSGEIRIDGGHVRITATEQPSGQTDVLLRVYGDGVNAKATPTEPDR